MKKLARQYGDIITCIIVFSALLALPVLRNRAILVAIPIYATIMLLLQYSIVNKKELVLPFKFCYCISFLSLIALYSYYLLPRHYTISLGYVTVSTFDVAKVLFVLSGAFALLTIMIKSLKSKKSCFVKEV